MPRKHAWHSGGNHVQADDANNTFADPVSNARTRPGGTAVSGAPGRYGLSCSILSLNKVVAIVALRGWPRRNASANFLACLYSTLPGSGGSSGLTLTSTSAGPSWPSALLIAPR